MGLPQLPNEPFPTIQWMLKMELVSKAGRYL